MSELKATNMATRKPGESGSDDLPEELAPGAKRAEIINDPKYQDDGEGRDEAKDQRERGIETRGTEEQVGAASRGRDQQKDCGGCERDQATRGKGVRTTIRRSSRFVKYQRLCFRNAVFERNCGLPAKRFNLAYV